MEIFIEEKIASVWAEDEMEEWEAYEDTLSGQVYRADGRVACGDCGFTYRRHPWSGENDRGGYFLRLLCSGERVKL